MLRSEGAGLGGRGRNRGADVGENRGGREGERRKVIRKVAGRVKPEAVEEAGDQMWGGRKGYLGRGGETLREGRREEGGEGESKARETSCPPLARKGSPSFPSECDCLQSIPPSPEKNTALAFLAGCINAGKQRARARASEALVRQPLGRTQQEPQMPPTPRPLSQLMLLF